MHTGVAGPCALTAAPPRGPPFHPPSARAGSASSSPAAAARGKPGRREMETGRKRQPVWTGAKSPVGRLLPFGTH
jgi:hypothetical protein